MDSLRSNEPPERIARQCPTKILMTPFRKLAKKHFHETKLRTVDSTRDSPESKSRASESLEQREKSSRLAATHSPPRRESGSFSHRKQNSSNSFPDPGFSSDCEETQCSGEDEEYFDEDDGKRLDGVNRLRLFKLLLFALGVHGMLANGPGLERFLQTRSHMGTLMATFLAQVPSSIIAGPLLFMRYGWRTIFSQRSLPTYAVIITVLAYAQSYSPTLTLAVHIQLILLLVPLIVAAIERVVFNVDVPRVTYVAIFFAAVGSFFALFGDLVGSKHDFSSFDFVGYAVTAAYAGSLVANIFYIREVSGHGTPAVIVWWWMKTIITVASLPTFIIDDWSIFNQLRVQDYMAWSFLVFICSFVTLGQIWVIPKIGAAQYSILYAFRMVAALPFDVFILGETLDAMGAVGTAIVTITIFCYVFYRYRTEQVEEAKTQAPEKVKPQSR